MASELLPQGDKILNIYPIYTLTIMYHFGSSVVPKNSFASLMISVRGILDRSDRLIVARATTQKTGSMCGLGLRMFVNIVALNPAVFDEAISICRENATKLALDDCAVLNRLFVNSAMNGRVYEK